MGKFQHASSKTFKPGWLKKAWPWLLVALLLISQVERFVHNGTILGYQVRTVKSKASIARQNKSGSIIGGKVAKENKPSIACETFSTEKVAKIVGAELERISGFVPDRTEPLLVSSCIYRTKGETQNARTVSVLLREQKDQTAAQKTMSTLKQSGKGEDIKKLGDEAYFNTSANQLTVRSGKKLITVTVPKPKDSKEDNKATAIAIAKLGL